MPLHPIDGIRSTVAKELIISTTTDHIVIPAQDVNGKVEGPIEYEAIACLVDITGQEIVVRFRR